MFYSVFRFDLAGGVIFKKMVQFFAVLFLVQNAFANDALFSFSAGGVGFTL
jgi:hypothetical protein